MKVLFIASGNHETPSAVLTNQAEALKSEGVEVEWYLLKGKGIKGYLRNVKPLRKYLREHKYDAIHAHFSLSAFVASWAGAKSLIVSLMGDDVKAARWYKFIVRLFAACYRWKAIIVKSNDMYQDLGMVRALVIPNGVNLERFCPKLKEECQKSLGWDSKKKHILFPANASRPVKDYSLAEAAVKELEIGDRKLENGGVEIHAFENTPNEDTPYWYNAADVVLMTSKWEGSPNAIKEAMACSRPIVSNDVGDVAERVANVDGCYVVHRDSRLKMIDELARSLEHALKFDKTKGRVKIIADGLDAHDINRRLIAVYKEKKRLL